MLSQLLYYLSAPFRRVLDSPLQVLSAPRRLWGMSLPARVAVAAFFVYLILSIVAWYTWKTNNPESAADWSVYLPIGMTLIVPLAFYMAIRVWLESEESRFPEIDAAWKAGLDALAEQNISLEEVPLYLVLGSHHAKEAASLFQASGIELTVKGEPPGGPPLCWFAGPDAAFIVCTETSQISLLAAGAMRPGAAAAPRQGGALNTISPDISRSMSLPPASDETQISAGSLLAARPYETVSPDAGPAFPQSPQRFGTMVQSQFEDPNATLARSPGRAAIPAAPVQLTSQQASEALEQLDYLCRLIRKARQPFCPINGILTVLPFPLLARSEAHARELQYAVQRDLDQIRATLQLRCQVIALTGSMQKEEGFLELMRRVGPEAAKSQRFGKGFNPWNIPTPEQMEAVAKHACGAFEDWTYHLFGQRGGHERIGNPKLYELLCKIRSQVAKPFSDLLAGGFGREPDPDEPALLFGGCYFAATGDTEDHQAFVRNVFDKLLEQQDYVDWTESARRENDWYQNLANLCYCVSAVFLLSILVIAVLWLNKE